MAYYFEKMSYDNGQWFANLLVPSNVELNDSLEYMTGAQRTAQNLYLLIESAKNQPCAPPNYGVVKSRHQIDNRGVLFVTNEVNHRSTTQAPLDTIAVRYANQYDFDKFCSDNPDEHRRSFDWNAEVYRAFVSSMPGTYTPALDSDCP